MRVLVYTIIRWLKRFVWEKFHYKNETFSYYVTILVAFLFFVIGLNGFVELTEELAEQELDSFDTAVTGYILSHRNDSLTNIFLVITHLGGRIAYFTLAGLLAIFFLRKHRSRKFILQTMLVLILASLSNVMLKEFINRARPPFEHLVAVSTLSYPSGHAMTAMAFYGFLIYLIIRFNVPVWLKILLTITAGLLIVAIGLSRIYLGVHYPSDVAAGFIGGIIWVTFCIILFNVLDLFRKRRTAMGELNNKITS